MQSRRITRRSAVKQSGIAGAAAFLGAGEVSAARASSQDIREALEERVNATSFVDTHEHLIEEEHRLAGKHRRIKSNDWSFLLSHYLDSDLRVSGMTEQESKAFFGSDVDPVSKWDILAPYWPRVRQTGYGRAVDLAVRKLYEAEGLGRDTVRKIQDSYRKTIQPGFYRKILQDVARIESCQVNSLDGPFSRSSQPQLLMQDISILGMHMGPDIETFAPPTGIEVEDLADWHRVIDWWFEQYGPYAVAVKSQAAYSRNIDFQDIPPERAEKVFRKIVAGEDLESEERKDLEDHLFWYCVRKATALNLPVKLHTGYYAGLNSMPLGRLQGNAAAASDLCRVAPDTRFVLMHIDYPFYEELIAVAKHYSNCYLDMCWAWIISPVASLNFLKQLLVTVPANKVLTFGGDYIPVEPVIGHAALARHGITTALHELVNAGWMSTDEALDLVDPIMRGNARMLFDLEKKAKALGQAPWA